LEAEQIKDKNIGGFRGLRVGSEVKDGTGLNRHKESDGCREGV